MIGAIFGIIKTIFSVIGIFVTVVGFLITVAVFIFEGFCLKKMAEKTGCEHPWFGFSPVLRKYLEFQIPPGDFNLWNILVVKDKKKLAICWIIIAFIVDPFFALLADIPYIGFIFVPITIILTIFVLVERWKRMYDIMNTFGLKKEKGLLPISIISTFIPIIYTVIIAIICNNEPDIPPAGSYEEI